MSGDKSIPDPFQQSQESSALACNPFQCQASFSIFWFEERSTNFSLCRKWINAASSRWPHLYFSTAQNILVGSMVVSQWEISGSRIYVQFLEVPNSLKSTVKMGRLMTKQTKWYVRSAKTQISRGIHLVWSESSLSVWRKLGSSATFEPTADTLISLGGSESSLGAQSFCWFCHAAHLISAIRKVPIFTIHTEMHKELNRLSMILFIYLLLLSFFFFFNLDESLYTM